MNRNELRALARSINSREEAIEILRKQTLDKAAEYMGEVLLQGQDLLRAKQAVPHGKWLAWLKMNCPKSVRSAQEYMRLAGNPEKAADFIAAGSIRKALTLLDPPKDGSNTSPRRWPPYMEAINRASKFIRFIKENPLENWPKEGIEQLKEDIQPIVAKLWPEIFGAPYGQNSERVLPGRFGNQVTKLGAGG